MQLSLITDLNVSLSFRKVKLNVAQRECQEKEPCSSVNIYEKKKYHK